MTRDELVDELAERLGDTADLDVTWFTYARGVLSLLEKLSKEGEIAFSLLPDD